MNGWLRAVLEQHAERFELECVTSCDSFRTQPGLWTDALCRAVEAATGLSPLLDTSGVTSDARFISRYCPVAEFGLVGATMHQINERVSVSDLRQLAAIYAAVLETVLR